MKNRSLVLSTLCFSLLTACQPTPSSPPVSNESTPPASPTPTPAGISERIDFKQAGLFPEGIDYSSSCQCFLVSSVRTGKVGKVMADGSYQGLTQDNDVISAIGLLVDEERQRVLVAASDQGSSPRSSDATRQKVAKLGIYDLNSGERKQLVELAGLKAGAHFANDIAIDTDGNAYVTDSKQPVIYKVTPEGQASVLVENAELGAAAEAFGLNGIVYHPQGYLIVAKAANNALYKVPLDKPETLSQVKMDALPASPDGLEWNHDGQLVVISNSSAKASLLSSSDNWANASVDKQVDLQASFPTTAARVQQDIYVLEAKLGMAAQGDAVTDFSIQRIAF